MSEADFRGAIGQLQASLEGMLKAQAGEQDRNFERARRETKEELEKIRTESANRHLALANRIEAVERKAGVASDTALGAMRKVETSSHELTSTYGAMVAHVEAALKPLRDNDAAQNKTLHAIIERLDKRAEDARDAETARRVAADVAEKKRELADAAEKKRWDWRIGIGATVLVALVPVLSKLLDFAMKGSP